MPVNIGLNVQSLVDRGVETASREASKLVGGAVERSGASDLLSQRTAEVSDAAQAGIAEVTEDVGASVERLSNSFVEAVQSLTKAAIVIGGVVTGIIVVGAAVRLLSGRPSASAADTASAAAPAARKGS